MLAARRVGQVAAFDIDEGLNGDIVFSLTKNFDGYFMVEVTSATTIL